jgi:hypothetical protein
MLIFVDGFSHYTQAFMGDKWDIVEHGMGDVAMTQSVNTNGRFGGGAARFTDANGGGTEVKQYMQKNYDGVGTIIVGFAVQQTGTQNVFNPGSDPYQGGRLLTFLSASSVQVALTIMPSGQIAAVRSTTAGTGPFLNESSGQGTFLGQSVSAISSSSYDFIEVKVVHHATTGSIEIKRNGAAFWTLSNVNTDIAGTGNSSSVFFGGYHVSVGGATISRGLKANITDVYILNTTVDGSDALNPVDFIGDRHWEPITPTADGADTAWTPDPVTNHFGNVSTVPPDTAKKNSTATLNARDGFIVSSPTGPTTATALVALTMYIQKNAGGSNEVKGFTRSAAPAYRNGTSFQVPTPYGFRQSFLCSKPGGGAITLADIAANQWGYEKTI